MRFIRVVSLLYRYTYLSKLLLASDFNYKMHHNIFLHISHFIKQINIQDVCNKIGHDVL